MANITSNFPKIDYSIYEISKNTSLKEQIDNKTITRLIYFYGKTTKNKLYLSNTEVTISNVAAYAEFQFLGKAEKNIQYKHSSTNDISLTFDLLGTINYIDGINSENDNKNKTWYADFTSSRNEMSPIDVYMCSNWLMSLTKPQKNHMWAPPEVIRFYINGFIAPHGSWSKTGIDCVVISSSKKIKEAAGYDIDDNGKTFPKCVTMSLTLRPVFDLYNIPFAEDVANGKYNL